MWRAHEEYQQWLGRQGLEAKVKLLILEIIAELPHVALEQCR